MHGQTMIAGDWGKGGLRLALVSGGSLEDQRTDPTPLADARGRHSEIVGAASADWIATHPDATFLFAGMIGGRGNWHETDYVRCPLSLGDLAHAAHRFEIGGRPAAIVPGACVMGEGMAADVMRGEEIQILGALALAGRGDALFCIPGTNAKWARASDGRLVEFATYITGDAFDYLRHRSMVGALAAGDTFDLDAFRSGMDHAEGRELLNAAFSARAAVLLGKLAPEQVSSYLSGLVIGAELGAAATQADGEVLLLAGGTLADRYGAAMAHRGLPFRQIDAAAARRAGMVALADKLWPAE